MRIDGCFSLFGILLAALKTKQETLRHMSWLLVIWHFKIYLVSYFIKKSVMEMTISSSFTPLLLSCQYFTYVTTYFFHSVYYSTDALIVKNHQVCIVLFLIFPSRTLRWTVIGPLECKQSYICPERTLLVWPSSLAVIIFLR